MPAVKECVDYYDYGGISISSMVKNHINFLQLYNNSKGKRKAITIYQVARPDVGGMFPMAREKRRRHQPNKVGESAGGPFGRSTQSPPVVITSRGQKSFREIWSSGWAGNIVI